MNTDPISVVVVDEDELSRLGVRSLLQDVEGVQIVGEAGTLPEALEQIDQYDPDVLIVGLALVSTSGLELARHAASHHLKTRVMVFSISDDECQLLEALHSGVAAYVLKTAEAVEILAALRWVARGHRYISPPFLERVLQVYAEHAAPAAHEALKGLSAREREIISLANDGLTNVKIGVQLGISYRTVEAHRASAMHKLGLHSQGELACFFLKLYSPNPTQAAAK